PGLVRGFLHAGEVLEVLLRYAVEDVELVVGQHQAVVPGLLGALDQRDEVVDVLLHLEVEHGVEPAPGVTRGIFRDGGSPGTGDSEREEGEESGTHGGVLRGWATRSIADGRGGVKEAARGTALLPRDFRALE